MSSCLAVGSPAMTTFTLVITILDFAQMLVAVIAFISTIMSTYKASLGEPTTALQTASGELWRLPAICLCHETFLTRCHTALMTEQIPVIFGWIIFGTQYSHHTIGEALHPASASRRLEPGFLRHGQPYATDKQYGVVVRAGFTPLSDKVHTTNGAFMTARDNGHLKAPTWMGAGFRGDESEEGLYQHAKLFTWWVLAPGIRDAVNETLNDIEDEKSCVKMYDRTNSANRPQRAANASQGQQAGSRVLLADWARRLTGPPQETGE